MFREWLVKRGQFIIIFSSLVGLIVIIGSVLYGIGSAFFTSSDVEVSYSFYDAELPTSIATEFNKVSDYVLNKLDDKNTLTIKASIINTLDFFTKTRNKVTFQIRNTSDRTLNNVDIRIKNVKKMTAWGVSGNILQSSEIDAIMKKMKNDETAGIVTFSNIEKLPPQTNMIIYLWGDIIQYSFDEPIMVTYDGGVGELVKTSTVIGFDSFIFENVKFLIFIWILINIAILLFVIDTYCKKKKNVSNQPEENS